MSDHQQIAEDYAKLAQQLLAVSQSLSKLGIGATAGFLDQALSRGFEESEQKRDDNSLPRDPEFGLERPIGELDSKLNFVDKLVAGTKAKFTSIEDRKVALVAATLLENYGQMQINSLTQQPEKVYQGDGYAIRQVGDVYSISDVIDRSQTKMNFYLTENGPAIWGENKLSLAEKAEFLSVYRNLKAETKLDGTDVGDLARKVATLGALSPQGSHKVLNDLKGMKAFGLINHTINQMGVDPKEAKVQVQVGGYILTRERGGDGTKVSMHSNDGRGELLSYTAQRGEGGISVKLDTIKLNQGDMAALKEIAQHSQYLVAELPSKTSTPTPSNSTVAVPLMTSRPLDIHPDLFKALKHLKNLEVKRSNEEDYSEERLTVLSNDLTGRFLISRIRANQGKLSEAEQMVAYEFCLGHKEELNQAAITLPTLPSFSDFMRHNKTELICQEANPESVIYHPQVPAKFVGNQKANQSLMQL
ncbi:MAG TPA: hypothetical protein DCL61_15495 [Cyanobacteria bacterium UBA12227]|nr:hypothetical protein [Cyanobacteria bacterium UBA12227]HAX88374.1 hypothetical protein [Cyanobacteria bacterium UBA11370]HBY80481.1 hypothetical protein [Cyanobacteria bacterium UBA11148]